MKKTTMLKKNYEFKNVLTKGKRFSGKYIIVYIMKNRLTENKLGIAISSKIANSVYRNKLKRLIRENYRIIENKINIGNSFVILLKKGRDVKKVNFFNIKDDFNEIIKQAKLEIS